jgi:acyl-coenzyme A synthetase/AMP-(fatty) acid ligase
MASAPHNPAFAPAKLPDLNDHTIELARLIDWHVTHNPTHPYATFDPEEDGGDPPTMTFLEFGRGCHRLACAVAGQGPVEEGEIVALLIVCDSIMYNTTVAGLIRAGLTVSLHA